MTHPDQPRPVPTSPDPARPDTFQPDRRGWLEHRRDKITDEIARNRRGDHKVPTWVLATILVAFVAGWAALVIFA